MNFILLIAIVNAESQAQDAVRNKKKRETVEDDEPRHEHLRRQSRQYGSYVSHQSLTGNFYYSIEPSLKTLIH